MVNKDGMAKVRERLERLEEHLERAGEHVENTFMANVSAMRRTEAYIAAAGLITKAEKRIEDVEARVENSRVGKTIAANWHDIARVGGYGVGLGILAAGTYFTYRGLLYSDPTMLSDYIAIRFAPMPEIAIKEFVAKHPNFDIVFDAVHSSVLAYCIGGLTTAVRVMKDHYEDGIPIRKTLSQAPSKIFSKTISPMMECVGRRLKSNYVTAMGYNCQV
jgi:hypothetical protein